MSIFNRKQLPSVKAPLLVLAALLICAGHAAGDLVAYYPLDQGFGNVAIDASGQGNHGTIVNAFWASGAYGTALRFDGVTDGYVNCGRDKSLDIAESGSVLVWFKPETILQGGLVCWGPGGSWEEQRLITLLNSYGNYSELGVYLADGTDYFRPYRGPLPPQDEWSHLAVTFTRRSIDIYIDGTLAATEFKKLESDLTGFDMLIGKTNGWYPIGFFKGLVDEVRIYNSCLSSEEVYALYKAEAPKRGKDTSSFDRVAIAPTLCRRSGTVCADLDYRGLAPLPQDLTIRADLLPAGRSAPAQNAEARAIAGEVSLSSVWGDASALFPVADLPPGWYTIRVRAFSKGSQVGEMARTTLHWPGREPGWERIDVKNNLCWELLNEAPGICQNLQFRFSTPRSGWVYCITEATGLLDLSLSGATPAAIRDPAGGSRQEAMRWITRGDHTVTLSGSGSLDRLVVRAVPTILFAHWPYIKIGLTRVEDPLFLDEYVLPNANAILSHGKEWFTGTWVKQQGGRWYQVIYKPLAEASGTAVGIHDYLTKTQGMTVPDLHGILVDEFYPGVPFYAEWTEACAMILDDPEFFGRRIIPYCGGALWDDPESALFLKTIVAGAKAAGIADEKPCIAVEEYYPELDIEWRAQSSLSRRLAACRDGLAGLVPDAAEHLIVVLSYLTEFAGENSEPEVDLKVFMEMQLRQLATEPRFFGLAGIEEYVSHHSDEESIRWAAALFRHYVLEGKRERLSPDPYRLNHIANGDFLDGTAGWTIDQAEADSVDVKSYKGYGILQHRRSHGYSTVLPFLRTRRSAIKANSFSRKIENLETGRLYSLELITGDYQDLLMGTSATKLHSLSIAIDGAEMLTGPKYRFQEAGKSAGTLGPFNENNPYWMNLHRQIFRPTSPNVTLTIRDWATPSSPGGPVGQEVIYNRIAVEPYYPEPP
jgi:hypothetical protein